MTSDPVFSYTDRSTFRQRSRNRKILPAAAANQIAGKAIQDSARS